MCISDSIYDCSAYLSYYAEGSKKITELEHVFINYLENVDYEEITVPSLINGEVLDKCGFFDTYPQHLSAVCSIKNENISGVTVNEIDESSLKFHNYYLTPSACVHVYPMLENKYDGKNTCYTFNEKVYRYENGDYSNKERLWEFKVREFVFVGTVEYVQSMLNMFKTKVLSYSLLIDSNAELIKASDTFYPTKVNNLKERLQLSNDLKYELLMTLDNRKIATASFNYHGTHFSKPFNFDSDGNIMSGCVGFGLDRWMLCLGNRQVPKYVAQ